MFEEAPKPLPGLAGESRAGDANGQWVRVLTSAGDRTVQVGPKQFAQAYRPILGTNPPKPAGSPPMREDVACETQEPPDLRTVAGPGDREVARGLPKTPEAQKRYARAEARSCAGSKGQLKREGLEAARDEHGGGRPVRRAIRKNVRGFLAVVALALIGLGVGGYILAHQRFASPSSRTSRSAEGRARRPLRP